MLVPCGYEHFEAHVPTEAARGLWARHAPPHVPRKEQQAYDALKQRWRERLLALLYRHYPRTKGRVVFCDVSTPLTLENYLRPGRGAAIGLDVTPSRFTDLDEIAELDMRHPRVPGLWRAGQDYLMCGQVLAAVSGIVCALRMVGLARALRFVPRAVRLLALGRRRLRSCRRARRSASVKKAT